MTIFCDTRVQKYSEAENKFPEVRSNELTILDEILKTISPFSTVLEIGSGNGFLTNWLKENYDIYLESIDPFFNKNKFSDNHYFENFTTFFTPDKLVEAKYDMIISLATFHHITNPDGNLPKDFLSVCSSLLRSDGNLVVCDVAPSTTKSYSFGNHSALKDCQKTGQLFETIINNYTLPSHNAYYLSTNNFKEQVQKEKFYNFRHFVKSCHWEFESWNTMQEYIIKLFNLNLTEDEFDEKLGSIGIKPYVKNKTLFFPWGLQCFVSQKR